MIDSPNALRDAETRQTEAKAINATIVSAELSRAAPKVEKAWCVRLWTDEPVIIGYEVFRSCTHA